MLTAEVLVGLLTGLALVALALPGEGALRLAGLSRPPTAPTGPVSAALPAAARHALTTSVLAGLLLAGLLLVGQALAGTAATVLLVVGSLAVRHRLRARSAGRTRDRERDGAGEACTALAAELRSGRSAADALAVAADLAHGPSRERLRAAVAAARLGGDVPAALRAPTDTPTAVPGLLSALAACWQVCSGSGTGLAASVDRLARSHRAREEQRRAVETALAGPRSTAGLLAVLPLAGIGLAAELGADPLHVLLHTTAGLICLVGGIALDALGVWWTGRIVARAAGP